MSLRFTPYVMLNGTAQEAIRFYEKSLGAEVVFKETFAESPDPIPEEAKDRVAHSVLKIGEEAIMIADAVPGQRPQAGDQLTICITTDDAKEATRLYDALQENGHINFPLEETYFSPAYGMVTDRYGVTFQISTRA